MGKKGELNISLGLTIRNFQKNLKKAQRSLQRAATNFQSIGRDMTQSISLPIAGLGGAALKASADIEQLRNALTSITGDSKETEKQLDRIRKIAEAPGIGFEQAIKATLQLQGLGVEARAAEETIKQVANVVAASGGGQDAFAGAVKQLNQIQAKNRVLQEDINILLENVPALGEVLQKTFGAKTAEGIRATGVTGQEFFAKLVIGLQDLERVQGGLKNSFENFGVAIRFALADLGNEIDKTFDVRGTLDKLSQAVQRITSAFKELSPEQKKAILQFAAITAAIGPAILIMGKLIGAARLTIVALKFLASPISLVIKGFTALRTIAIAAGGGLKGLAIALRAVGTSILSTVAIALAITAAIVGIAAGIIYVVRNAEFFRVAFLNIWTKIKIGVARRINGLIDAVQPLFKALGIEVGKLEEPFDKLLDLPERETFKEFISGVSDDVKKLAPGLFNAAEGFKKLKQSLTGTPDASGVSDVADQPGISDQELLNAFGGGGNTAGGDNGLSKVSDDVDKATKSINRYGLSVKGANEQSQSFSNSLATVIPSLEAISLKAQVASNVFVGEVAKSLEEVQLRADALGLDSASDQFDTLGEKVNIVKRALEDAAVQFGVNSSAAISLRETLAPLQEQYNALKTAQEQIQATTEAVNTGFAEGAAAAQESSEQQQSAFAAAAGAALAASAKVVKAELQKAVATQIAQLLASVPPPFNLILAAGAGAAVGAIFQKAINALGVPGLAKGGIIPPGFPNDTFPAMLSSNEAVIPLNRLSNYLDPTNNVAVSGEFRLRGNDLIAAVDVGNYNKNRRV